MVQLRFPRAFLTPGRIQPLSLHRFFKPNAARRRNFQMPAQTYKCDIDAEPLHRYQPGGYHPLGLGDVLKDGQYKILYKLGWGSYSTIEDQYVAIKVSVSDRGYTREPEILRAISALPRRHPGWSNLSHMLDHFTVVGPNGTHDCLALGLVGPSVADVVASHCRDERLPAKLAKVFANQALQGLDFLASHDIGHGDLHTRNLAITVPNLNSLDEKTFSTDGKSLARNVPSHVVRPAPFRKREMLLSSPSVKIIDFGEAFFNNNPPNTVHTLLPIRAPEVIFGDVLDHRVDLWSAGCLLFELITGQPPFDVIMLTPPVLAQQMIRFATDELPSRWRDKWQAMQKDPTYEDDRYTLQEWLAEVYFDDDKYAEFKREDIVGVGKLIESMLKFEPSLRAAASDTLADAWLNRECL
ncbi:hypothetical protein LCI18_002154 [Fusarium solani-melongenae]|uniref:Uncharacterized protein n=1 Tax=Fusarium solani subsp. cucurbitae TaxID=2747967 RepID=A0ACD3YQF8_FUSSC|nr:hypothetical protein LCI18_002154 [Fusarium solani-melongenae]